MLAAGAIWAPHAFTGATVTVPAGSVITGVYTQQSAVLGDSLAGHLSAGDICVQTGTVVAFGHRQGTYACFAN